ncbi:type II secretion system protein [Hydrogenimonas sp.]|uniref:type II secretion system protein n=1 Tax=Hydrogenimonas sp. TaxID=2231112 RepID=UPI0026296EEA|nr:type II secretion system protein [Hydrogenimonas sp.]
MKKAFTLIELIFVIVILGILAAVAIPKLNATREDAIVAKKAKLITASINEIAAHAFGQKSISGGLTTYSNILREMKEKGEVVPNGNDNNLTFLTGNNTQCIILSLVNGNQEQNLSVSYGNPNNDTICIGLQRILHNSNYSIVLRKNLVNY